MTKADYEKSGTGCKVELDCLKCTEETCRYDTSRTREGYILRRKEANLLRRTGLSTEEISNRLGVSIWTARRYTSNGGLGAKR